MSIVVGDLSKKKLVEYLYPGARVLVQFNRHGIGDQIMFQPLYQRLKVLHPEVEWHLEPNRDQQYFKESPEAPVDLVFNIAFKETAGMPLPAHAHPRSKAHRCAVEELGIPFGESLDFTWRPGKVESSIKLEDNCIGVETQIQSVPHRGLDEKRAQLIWDYIKHLGFTPIEVCFNNFNFNTKNIRPKFVDYSCRDFEASEENMFSVIQQCKGFVGVNTGTFCAATCILNAHVLHLYTGYYHFSPWYKEYNPVMEMNCQEISKFNWRALDAYLKSCSKT